MNTNVFESVLYVYLYTALNNIYLRTAETPCSCRTEICKTT